MSHRLSHNYAACCQHYDDKCLSVTGIHAHYEDTSSSAIQCTLYTLHNDSPPPPLASTLVLIYT